jgi:valyl-tRNA synthetase
MSALPAQYDQTATEKKWQRHWVEAKTYAWDEAESRENSYVIDTPPPTVSGTLHMGHVFSYTQADFIARFQRMAGKNVFYPMGFDDNGLPTERLVEKTKKIRAADMTREAFIAECLGVSEEARKEFRTLFESIALSVDWAQEYHTISDDSRRLSQLSFLDLVNKGHCYRSERPFYWDPVDQTAIASAEIEDKELPSFANDIIFVAEGTPLTIMTTRPELLPACVALFCHPEDARYTHLHGKEAEVPLFGFSVPILTDVTVDPEKGTGLMMCCTFGDDADILKWQKHQLPTRVVINKFGRMEFTLYCESPQDHSRMHIVKSVKDIPDGFEIVKIDPANGSYKYDQVDAQYNDKFEAAKTAFLAIADKKISNSDPKHPGARQIILELLKEAGVLVKQTPITHAVKCAERSGAPLEILPTHQWFVKVVDKKEALTAKARECVWNPDWMRLRIEQWIDGLNQDWCISRQRYFGVPFPVWYSLREGEKGKAIYAAADQLPVNPLVDLPKGYTREEVIADLDVMDTWATSSISPQLSAHGINAETAADKNRFAKLYPADLRPQAHEIIRTWAFYTIVKSYLHSDSIPWKNLMISGWCLAEDKSKMSKSKGNVITPTALIEERGTDAVRYWAATSRLGTDTAFSPDLLKIGKKLVGKLWNATQFAAIHLNKLESAPASAAADLASGAVSEVIDRWILSRLAQTVSAATEAFNRYEYADALDATNNFFWADFCDNYLELIKKRVYNEDGSFTPAQTQSAVRTLYYVLDGILKLYAPIVPHVTEELYSHIFADAYAKTGSLHARGMWVKPAEYAVDDAALAMGAEALAILARIRTEKSSTNRSIKFPIEKLGIPAAAVKPELWMGDVAGAGNVRAWEASASVAADSVAITFAAEADAA